jgi:hypothetical protein
MILKISDKMRINTDEIRAYQIRYSNQYEKWVVHIEWKNLDGRNDYYGDTKEEAEQLFKLLDHVLGAQEVDLNPRGGRII